MSDDGDTLSRDIVARLTVLEADVRRYLDALAKLTGCVEQVMQRLDDMDSGEDWKR